MFRKIKYPRWKKGHRHKSKLATLGLSRWDVWIYELAWMRVKRRAFAAVCVDTTHNLVERSIGPPRRGGEGGKSKYAQRIKCIDRIYIAVQRAASSLERRNFFYSNKWATNYFKKYQDSLLSYCWKTT